MSTERNPVTDLIAAFALLRPRVAHLINEARAAQDMRTVTELEGRMRPGIDKAIAILEERGDEAVSVLRQGYAGFDAELRELEGMHGTRDTCTRLVTPEGRWIDLTADMRRFPTGERVAGVEVDGVRYRVLDVSLDDFEGGSTRVMRLAEFEPAN